MAKNTRNTSRGPAPKHEPEVSTEAKGAIGGKAQTEAEASLIEVDGRKPAKGNRSSLFAQASSENSKRLAEKAQLMGSVSQKLAHAVDLYREGDVRKAEADEEAAEAAKGLYQARVKALASAEEVSAVLGDQFGYAPKSDGTPGKTPAGQGSTIRKRVVRAVQAAEYVNGGDGGSFFSGLPADEVEDIVIAVNNGSLSIFTAYERFAKVKTAHAVRLEMAFDPKKIGAIVDALSEAGAADRVAQSPALIAAYGALLDVLHVIGEVPAEDEAE